jgi:hypothetical protein
MDRTGSRRGLLLAHVPEAAYGSALSGDHWGAPLLLPGFIAPVSGRVPGNWCECGISRCPIGQKLGRNLPSAVLLRNATPSLFHQRHIGRVLRSS